MEADGLQDAITTLLITLRMTLRTELTSPWLPIQFALIGIAAFAAWGCAAAIRRRFDLVAATMDGISGARVVASFGEQADGQPSVVVYELDQETDPRVSLQDWEGRAVVSGGPEVVPDVLAGGLATPDQAVVLAGPGEDADVVTDSNRRVERSFGRVHEATSGVMTRGPET